MLKPITISLALTCIQSFAFSQSFKTDSSQSAKNELSFVLGVGSGAFSPDYVSPSRIPQGIISFEYARVLKEKHFIRLGHRVALGALERKDLFSFMLYPTPESGAPASQATKLKTKTQYSFERYMSSLYVGYNHQFTNRNHGLVLGADLHIGFTELKATKNQMSYYETIEWQTASGMYAYQYDFESYGIAHKTTYHVFAGISPSIGYRYKANPYLSIGFNYTPLIGYSHQFREFQYKIYYKIPEPPITHSFWFFQNNLEIKLIFPLNHRVDLVKKS
ncbi:MAG: hypothetical protein MH137_13325 [Flavobacteriales bacterium]|nr:hypothetical protein [Flavobacteriales bacterium]